MKHRTAIVGTIVLTILLAAFAGSALAGNGNENGNGNGVGNGNSPPPPTAPAAATPTPGNSASAPGQAKKSSTTTATVTATTTASPGGRSAGHGSAKKSSAAATTSAQAKKSSAAATTSAQGSASQNAGSQAGMKPTNATTHHTFCQTGGGSSATCTPTAGNTAGIASAKPDVSKRYGNGKTAAQIAVSRGAPANTRIYGPGNSQPHKVETCPGSGHWVDVHAVKRYSAASCATQQTQSAKAEHVCGATTVTTTSTRTQHGHAYGLLKHGKALHTKGETESVTTPTGESCGSSNVFETLVPPILISSTSQTSSTSKTSGSSQTSSSSQASQTATAQQSASSSQTAAAGASANAAGSTPAGGVLGASATRSAAGKPAGGVAGALTAVGNAAGQSLPFTGFPLWIAVLAAVGLILAGIALRRRGRAIA